MKKKFLFIWCRWRKEIIVFDKTISIPCRMLIVKRVTRNGMQSVIDMLKGESL